jgi:hypothetical protein
MGRMLIEALEWEPIEGELVAVLIELLLYIINDHTVVELHDNRIKST